MTPPSRSGDLPAELRAAAADVIEEQGLGAFSLREVARRAGVSHAAPGYHFGDTCGLLTSLAVEGFELLAAEMIESLRGVDDPVEQLTRIGKAYVRVAVARPAHFEVIFRGDVIDDEATQDAGDGAFALLEGVIQRIADDSRPDLDVLNAARLCWSAMEGLVVLHPKFVRISEAAGESPQPIEEQVERFTDLMLHGMVGPA
jgi:AcrR family transcriptional regulator